MKTHRHIGFERAVPTLMALVLAAACSDENPRVEADPGHGGTVAGPDGGSVKQDASAGKQDASAADGSHASLDGGTDDGGGSASSDANVDGSGFGGVLTGDPASPARAAMTNVPAPPAADADIVDNVIMSRLDVWLQPDATVGQVNAAVAGIGGRVLSMTVGSSVISVTFPLAPNQATLEQKRQAVEASPGILFAEQATLMTTDTFPVGAASDDVNIGHLVTARFPAAWNLSALAQKNCISRRVNVMVLDKFNAPIPSTFGNDVQGFKAPALAGTTDHGWRVSSVIAASSFTTTDPVTGANPYNECLNIQGVQAANVSMAEADANLWQSLPGGKVIVNVSLGHTGLPSCNPCSAGDFAGSKPWQTWLPYGIKVATEWRELTLPLGDDDDIFIAQAAGNDGNTSAGTHYAMFRNAQLSGPFAVGASPQIFGPTRLTVLNDPSYFAPDAAFEDYPSLYPSADLRGKLSAYVMSHVPDNVGPLANVVIAGATTRGAPSDVTLAPFSNTGADVDAVGTAVVTVTDSPNVAVDGTSFAAPQVAGLASYLWVLSEDLYKKPTSFTRQAIVENERPSVDGPQVLDAYAAVLSLDAAEPVTPTSAPIRLALLDINNDGAFNETDVQDFATALVGARAQPPQDWDRHDLNGDGYAGVGTARFDLDRVGSLQYGLASYQTAIQETYKGQTLTFDETAVTDLQIVCYYAYSALYTGDPAMRDDAIGVACGINPPGDGGGGGGDGGAGGGGAGCIIYGQVFAGAGDVCSLANNGNTMYQCCPNQPLACTNQGILDQYGNWLYLCEP